MRILRPTRTLLLPAVLVALASSAATAQANIAEKIIDRCTHGESLSGFSQKAYSEALKELSAGTEEYSNCAQLIRQAQLAAAGRGGGAGGGAVTPTTGAVTPTPSEQKVIAHAHTAGSAPLQVGSETIHPGVVPVNIASALSSLPTPLLATVAFLLVCLLLAVGSAIRNRVRNVRRPD
ncbi:MAG TPA: hypothetical protein VJ996_03150 [Solirubrobacteraceae bacterium]|nr:hypothetical protein [Solirubrobacteraceae bacterium]